MTQTPPPIQPQSQPMQAVAVPQPVPQKGGGMSIAAFVLGLLGFVPFCGLIAVILGIIALATKRAKKGFAIAGLVLGVVMMFSLPAILLPALSLAKFRAKQIVCMSNLKQIGLGLLIYATDNDGQYPPALEDVIEADFISEKMLRSPADKIDRACSYFYFAPEGKVGDQPGEAFMVCTFDNVYDYFRHVLYFDGTVKKLSEAEFRAELAKPYNTKFAAALKTAEGP